MAGTLYVVATPIGNLEDITLRALRLLKEADLIAAEDTRHSRKLLSHFEIATPLMAYHQHSEYSRVETLIRKMTEEGLSIALVTDAGTPGVSDPGQPLVEAAIAAGVAVVPVPGASAALSALVGSGLPTARFTFEGFLPRVKGARRAKLESLAQSETRTMIFYEAGNRTTETLRDMAAAFGPTRLAAVGRELTKKHEEFVRGGLAEAATLFAAGSQRGEVTIVVAGLSEESPDVTLPMTGPEAISAGLAEALANGMSERDAVRHVSGLLKLGRRDVYAAMLTLKNAS